MTFNDQLQRWFQGDADAVRFALTAWEAAQEWDDIEDEGRCAQPHEMIAWLAFGKEYDPFFILHAARLRPVMESVYLQWRAANVLERSPVPDEVAKAWMLRAGYYQLVHMIALLTGGPAWAAEVGPEIYRAYGENLFDFRREMAREMAGA